MFSDEPCEPEGSDDVGDQEPADMYDPTMLTEHTQQPPAPKPAPSKVPAQPAVATTAAVCMICALLIIPISVILNSWVVLVDFCMSYYI